MIAQDLGDFGKDGEGAAEGEGTPALTALLRRLVACEPETPGTSTDKSTDKEAAAQAPFWLRLLYLYPDEVISPPQPVDRRLSFFLVFSSRMFRT